ncbi:MAG: hypothetical protein QM703_17400 [Gemmatales bacterium]
MTSGVGSVQLADAMKKMLLKWEETTPHWNDSVRKEFEKRFIEPLVDQVKFSLQAQEDLSRVMQACYHDCK